MSTFQTVLILELLGLMAALAGMIQQGSGPRKLGPTVLMGLGCALLLGGAVVAWMAAVTGTWVS